MNTLYLINIVKILFKSLHRDIIYVYIYIHMLNITCSVDTSSTRTLDGSDGFQKAFEEFVYEKSYQVNSQRIKENLPEDLENCISKMFRELHI